MILILVLFVLGAFSGSDTAIAGIYEPEGLNMPGGWNGWTNPPANNLALASSTQVTGGRVIKINSGTVRWQTSFSVATAGGDIVGGTYPYLFTSGSTGNPWGNKWGGVTVAMNTLQNYTLGGSDNQITVVDGKWYTMNWKDNGYANTQAIYMETSSQPVTITDVSMPLSGVPSVALNVSVTTSLSLSPEEIVYIRYTTDSWATSTAIAVLMTGNTGTAVIPGQVDGTTIQCYAFTSTIAGLSSDYDMKTLNFNNNGGLFFSCLVGAPPISWANISSPSFGIINPGESLDVYAQAFIQGTTGQATQAPGLQGWIGYSTSNTNPNTWTDWVVATYNAAAGSNDEFKASIGSSLSPGTYYYASRFQLPAGPFVYGGYNAGIWNGTSNVSGILTVNGAAPTVTTGAVSNIGGTTASVDATVIADGGSTVTDRGICWSTSANPSLTDHVVSNGNGIGFFTTGISSLSPGTAIHVRAYATNSTGTAYGDDVQFNTYSEITFNLDMTTSSVYVPGTDVVYVAGGFPGAVWNEPGTNPALAFVAGTGGAMTLTLYMPNGTYEYKYFLNATWGGGEWVGGNNRSITVTGNAVVNNTWGGDIEWANIQWPANGTIDLGGAFDVYSQVFIPNGRTGGTAMATGLQAWIGYSTTDTDPSTWNNWIPAVYFGAAGSNDEFKTDLGSNITATGTYYYVSRYQVGASAYIYGGFNSGFWNGTSNVSGVLQVNEPPVTKTLNVKVFLEGLFAGGASMNKAQDENGEHFAGNVADQVTIELHNAANYSVIEYSAANVDLMTDGSINISTIPAIHSGSYYITIKHRNSVETTTAAPISFADATISYDFSVSASQAFGDNLKVIDGVYCIFGGDENLDGLVDSTDLIDIDNDTAAFGVGYIATDVNGDGLVDSTDLILVDNNATAFIYSILP